MSSPTNHTVLNAALLGSFGGPSQLDEFGYPTPGANPWLKQFRRPGGLLFLLPSIAMLFYHKRMVLDHPAPGFGAQIMTKHPGSQQICRNNTNVHITIRMSGPVRISVLHCSSFACMRFARMAPATHTNSWCSAINVLCVTGYWLIKWGPLHILTAVSIRVPAPHDMAPAMVNYATSPPWHFTMPIV